jgi:hypothetical protein
MIKIELTPEIIAALDVDAARAVLTQLTRDLKSDVDERIVRIKSELADVDKDYPPVAPHIIHTRERQKDEISEVQSPKQSVYQTDSVPVEVLKTIQERYDNGNESLQGICRDYPQYKYRTIWQHMTLKKKVREVKTIPYVEPKEEPMKIATSHINKKDYYDYEREEGMSKKEVKVWFNTLLDNPAIPIWRINEMYQGIYNDKDKLSTEKLAKKYGTSEARIISIINKNCYQDDE